MIRRLVLAWLFLVAVAVPVSALQTSGDLSVCVLTFELPSREGGSLAPDLRSLLEDGLATATDPSLGRFLLSRGATWRTLETPTTLQLGLFLPMPPAEAEEIATVLCKHLSFRLAATRFPSRPATWVDGTLQYCRHLLPQTTPATPRVTLWLNPSLQGARKKLGELLPSLALPAPTSPATPSADLVCPNLEPRVIHLALWNEPTPEDIVSARFLGERFVRLPGARGSLSFDLWTLPQAVVLALVATGPIDSLWERDALAADFLRLTDDPASSAAWTGFAAQCVRVHQNELLDLEKGSFLEAWFDHMGIGEFTQERFAFRRPDRIERLVCLPNPLQHRFTARLDSRPRLAALSGPAPSDTLEVSIALRGKASVLARLARSIDQVAAPELSGSTHETTPQGLFLWRWSVRRPGLTYSLSLARSLLTAALKLDGTTPPPDEFPGLDIAVVAVGSCRPFELFGLLQQGWPQRPAPAPAPRILDLDSLRSILDLPAAPPGALRGRWTIQTATGSGLARLVARLLLDDIPPESLESVSRLF
ncbi:MAG: hypothetical protein GX442_11070 [Candidatus Riflebacteria bacterium]|nr:hypothetical protein [Candidatus Riflebacteria bacterium]